MGPKCFGPRIRRTKFPTDFGIAKHIQPYDGAARPDTWLQDYFQACCIAKGGNSLVAVRYLPLMLRKTGRSWLNELPKNTINHWYDMQSAFFRNFEGTYRRPCTVRDLQRCVQQPGETCRDYLRRWIDTKNSYEGVNDQTAIEAFIAGLPIGLLRHRLKCNKVTDLGQLIEIASKYADADDDSDGMLNGLAIPTHNKSRGQQNQKRKKDSDDKPNPDKAQVHATFGSGSRGGHGGGRGRGSGGSRVHGRGDRAAYKAVT